MAMKRSARRHLGLEPLADVLHRDSALRVPKTVETSPIAYRDWEAAVGSRIAARARPASIDRGVLYVRTATATWAQELALLSEQIRTQLRARGITVDTLRFRVGPVDAPERPPTRDEVRTSPPVVPLPPPLRAELARIADPELREAIARAAGKNLGWQSTLPAPPPPRPRRAATSAPSTARAPRSAGTGSDPPARTPRPPRAAPRGRPGPR
jgi:hypothetical protein